MMIQATIMEAVQDARNMASLFYDMKSGMDTWHTVFKALETKYEPYFPDVFWNEFYDHISKHPHFKTFEYEFWGDV